LEHKRRGGKRKSPQLPHFCTTSCPFLLASKKGRNSVVISGMGLTISAIF
jgi:hypothetical protein